MKNFFQKKIDVTQQKLMLELKNLSQHFIDILKFFSETIIKIEEKSVKLIELPWFILLGAPESGKSTLLEKSRLEFIPLKQVPQFSSQAPLYNFSVTKQAIFLDITSKYFSFSEFDTDFKQFFLILKRLLKKYQRKKPLKGLILTLSINDIFAYQTGKNHHFDLFNRRLNELTQTLTKRLRLPLTLIITQSDLIFGFKEYFAKATSEERQATFGITFDEEACLTKESCYHFFEEAYQKFLKNIHFYTLKYLHHEKNYHQQIAIQHFPLELENFKPTLLNFLKEIFFADKIMHNFYLTGIYFTSSLQQGEPIDFCKSHFKNSTVDQHFIQPIPYQESKPYFIHHLLNNFTKRRQIPKNSYQIYPWLRQTCHIGSYTTCILGACFAFYLGIANLNQDIQGLNEAQTALVRYKTLLGGMNDVNLTPLESLVSPLNALYEAKTKLHFASKHWWFNFFYTNNAKQMAEQADKTYHFALQTMLMPQIRELLATELSANQIELPSQLYATLKTYLMLGDPAYLKPDWIEHWAREYWLKNNPQTAEMISQLLVHLKYAVASQNNKVGLNNQLIATVRAKLYSLPTPQLAYALLMSETSFSPEPNLLLINPNETHGLFKQVPEIPYFFTKRGFDEIFKTNLPRATQTALHGDWVLGRPPTQTSEEKYAYDTLYEQTKDLYLADYVEVWQDRLQHFTLAHYMHLNQINNAIYQLLQDNSVLMRIANIIKENTAFLNEETITNPYLAAQINNANQQFQELSFFSEKSVNTNEAWKNVQKSLKDLQVTLNLIIKAQNSGLAAFQLSDYRINHPQDFDAFNQLAIQAQQLPQPASEWFKQLSQQSWQLVLNTAQNYINAAWLNKIMPFYDTYLQNHYPLTRSATLDAPISSFEQFFGHQGIFDQFFQTYLIPFINMQTQPWTLKTRDNLGLPIPVQVLTQLQDIYEFKQQFFPNYNNHIALPIRLIPIAFTPDIKHFNLQIDNENFQNFNERPHELHFTWPQNTAAQFIRYDIISTADETLNATFTGPWALLKMIDSNYIEVQQDNKHLEIVLTLNGHSAKYELVTENEINPFLPTNNPDLILPKNLWS
jgi:type VI secretion system protein ImpL